MSWEHAETVYKKSKSKGSARAVLAYLAHRMNEDNECWPSRETIAKELGIAVKTVGNALKSLAELGEISISRRQYFNVYTFQIGIFCPSGDGQIGKLGHSDRQNMPTNSNKTVTNNSHLNSKVKETPLPTTQENFLSKSEAKKPHHRFSKFEISQEFVGHDLDFIWQVALDFMDLCSTPKWNTFSSDLWEAKELEGSWPEREEIGRIVAGIRLNHPDGKCWPSQLVQSVRDGLRDSVFPQINPVQAVSAYHQPDADGGW